MWCTGLSCSVACGIFLDQGSNPCLLHWQVDSLPLSHQGSLEWGSLSLNPTSSPLIKNPPAMRETWVRCLGWKDPLEKGRLCPQYSWASLVAQMVKELACNEGDLGLISRLGFKIYPNPSSAYFPFFFFLFSLYHASTVTPASVHGLSPLQVTAQVFKDISIV